MTSATNALVFRAISDPTRRAILDALTDGERAACSLLGPFRISQPALSKHLRVLRDAGLVSQRKVGRERLYRLEPLALKLVADWVLHYQRFWNRKLDALGRLLDATPDQQT